MPEATRYLNLGCGSRYHPDWINIDITPQSPEVIQHDLSRGIPLPDASCDVIYHAAVLEHMRREDAVAFMTECYRVLKPGGIVRVGVPDLEKICQLYLSRMAAAVNGDISAKHDYDWIMLEFFDQMVREKSGGGMLDYLRQDPLPNETFVYERIGVAGRQLVDALRRRENDMRSPENSPVFEPAFLQKLLRRLRRLPSALIRHLLWLLLGAKGRHTLEIGRFRLTGEVHQWMYDRYSLTLLLCQTGFREPQLQSANTSLIPQWARFHLDTLPNGQVIKPDLFFMEAVKPEVVVHE